MPKKKFAQFRCSASESSPLASHEGTDEDFLQSLREGSSSAFEELQRLYSPRLLKQIIAITQNREDAEDALQDTFLQAFHRGHTFEGRSHIATWLTRIAINAALRRTKKRRSHCEISLQDFADSENGLSFYKLRDPGLNPEQIFEQRQKWTFFEDVVQRLHPTLRTTIQAWITEECSMKELAERLNISVGATKTRIHRARRWLHNSQLLLNSGSIPSTISRGKLRPPIRAEENHSKGIFDTRP